MPRGTAVKDRQGRIAGRVTSACLSPTFGCGLALAYVGRAVGSSEALVVDGIRHPVTQVTPPFHDPARSRGRVRVDDADAAQPRRAPVPGG
jgi:glycine cleavage system aminomethyltransferase T